MFCYRFYTRLGRQTAPSTNHQNEVLPWTTWCNAKAGHAAARVHAHGVDRLNRLEERLEAGSLGQKYIDDVNIDVAMSRLRSFNRA